jgi:hypothetical protein
MDQDHFKNKYQEHWARSTEKEKQIAQLIASHTGKQLTPRGLGAESTEMLSGNAASHGHTKGDADYTVENTEFLVEVTGPFAKTVRDRDPLWIRPDKITAARAKYPGQTTIVFHKNEGTGLIRTVVLDEIFFAALDANNFPIVHPSIKGQRETYHEIAANHQVVTSLEHGLELIKR